RHLHLVAVVLVRNGIDDGHRPGQGELELAPGMRAGKPRLRGMDAALEPQRSDDSRHHRLVTVAADAHLDAFGKVDALDELQKAMDEMLARLLAVADDVDPGILLLLDR